MYSTTGFSRESIVDLGAMIHNETMDDKRPSPPILGLFKSVTVALTYMRRNRVQEELAETYGVSQPTISRAITGMTLLLGKAFSKYVPTADDLDERPQYIVDGTLLPCWSWATHPELYSGKVTIRKYCEGARICPGQAASTSLQPQDFRILTREA
jgi:hypothetical protein